MSALDPAAVAFLAERAAGDVLPDHRLTVAQMRAAADRSTVAQEGSLPVVTEDRSDAIGPAGPVPVRVITPGARPLGIVVYAHGGGHVTGTLDSYDRLARRLAASVPATVVLVGYRRAPEHRCPAPVDDCQAVYSWVVRHRQLLGDDQGSPIAIAGDSAGGNVTAVLARRLRDTDAVAPVTQVLIYPTLDAVGYRRSEYASHRDCATGFGLLHADGLAYWDHYLGPDQDPASADASPLRTADLSRLPPALVLTAEYDVLRDEGRAYVERLRDAGVAAGYRQYDGQLHGFVGDPDRYPAADDALRVVARHLARHFSPGGSHGVSATP